MGFIEHFKKRGLKDLFNSKKVEVFVEAKKEDITGINIPSEDAIAYAEQVVYRTLKCKECVRRGSCIGCGCPTEDLMRTRIAQCGMKDEEGEDAPLWQSMMPTEKWNQLKKDLNFEFEIKIKDE